MQTNTDPRAWLAAVTDSLLRIESLLQMPLRRTVILFQTMCWWRGLVSVAT